MRCITCQRVPPARAGHRRRIARARIERLDGEAVGAPALQFFERRALEHAVDELAPLLVGRRRKFGGKRQIVGVASHGRTVPTSDDYRNRGGSLSIPVASILASASLTRTPAITRSGAMSLSGTSTKARSNSRGCGSIRSASFIATSS